MIEVVRSPARVSWHIKCNGIFIEAVDLKRDATNKGRAMACKFGLTFKG